MRECDELRPLLDRVAEGEASPDEAMATARHLPRCTACRILLARARRLAEVLEQNLDDPLQVGEEFVRDVMASLPEDRPRKRRYRGLKLAGWAGLLALAPLTSLLRSRVPSFDAAAFPSLPRPEMAAVESLLAAVAGLGRLMIAAIDTLTTGIPTLTDPVLDLAAPAALIAGSCLAAAAGVTTCLALATHSIRKQP